MEGSSAIFWNMLININNKVLLTCVSLKAHLHHRIIWYRQLSLFSAFLRVGGPRRSGDIYTVQVQETCFVIDQNASSIFQEQHASECVKCDALISDHAKHDWWYTMRCHCKLKSRDKACVITDRCHAPPTFQLCSVCRGNFNVDFNVNFNVLLSKYIVHLVVKMKETLIHIYNFTSWQRTESRS